MIYPYQVLCMSRREHDANTAAAALISRITGTESPRGEELTDDAELKRKFLEAKERERLRQKRVRRSA